MQGLVVAMLDIGKALIPCERVQLYMQRICTTIQFTTSVWPSIWGWKAVDLVSLVSSSDQRLDQIVLRN